VSGLFGEGFEAVIGMAIRPAISGAAMTVLMTAGLGVRKDLLGEICIKTVLLLWREFRIGEARLGEILVGEIRVGKILIEARIGKACIGEVCIARALLGEACFGEARIGKALILVGPALVGLPRKVG
jgi:hypothetical protein